MTYNTNIPNQLTVTRDGSVTREFEPTIVAQTTDAIRSIGNRTLSLLEHAARYAAVEAGRTALICLAVISDDMNPHKPAVRPQLEEMWKEQ